MSEIDIEKNFELFERIFNIVMCRQGVSKLMEYLQIETDFFTAPCSTRYHLCEKGGLVQHSLAVYNIFYQLCSKYYPSFSEESIAICSLFHDICKANTYVPVKKSRKTGKTLPNGKPEWEDYNGYDFDEAFPYGHGEKSVYILRKFIELTDEEAMAIRWHMGFSDATFKGGQQTITNAIQKYPVIALLHAADLIATSRGE